MDLRTQLTDADPVAREPELDALHAQTMRQRVVLAARHAKRTERMEREGFSRAFSRALSRAWLQPVAVLGALAVCLAAGIAAGLRMNNEHPVASTPAAQISTPRQLHFATAGGTRIIWTFNQELSL
jgi:hypothetical protein